MILRFEDWLNNQQNREDLIGDLARVLLAQDPERIYSRRKADEHKIWADIVIKIIEPGDIVVFNAAWQEFLLAKKAAIESSD